MEKPNVVLKKVKTFQGRDGYGLNAEVWINGVYCTYVIDDGNGGCLDFQYNLKIGSDNYNAMIKERIKLLEDYIATLPNIVSDFTKDDGSPFTYKQDLESYINQLVDDMQNAKEKIKFEKRIAKLFETAIVIGIPDSDNCKFYRQERPLSAIKTEILQSYVNSISKTKCVGNVQILNTNLKALCITY